MTFRGALTQLQELQDTRAQHSQDMLGMHRQLEELQQSLQSANEVHSKKTLKEGNWQVQKIFSGDMAESKEAQSHMKDQLQGDEPSLLSP